MPSSTPAQLKPMRGVEAKSQPFHSCQGMKKRLA